MNDQQQEYHAAPDHPLDDLQRLHALGYAIKCDGDNYLKFYRKKDTA